MTRLCICGGGSLGHVCAGVLSSQEDVQVNIFTQHPERWSNQIKDINERIFKGRLNVVSSNPEEAVKDCDIVLLCLPGYAIETTLKSIKPF